MFRSVFMSRPRLLALGTAFTLSLALGASSGVPAMAGSGVGDIQCNDNSALAGGDDLGIGGTGLVGDSPVTAGVELGAFNGLGDAGHVMVCYSTSPYGFTGQEISGGGYSIEVLGNNGPGSHNPGLHTLNLACVPSTNNGTFVCIPVFADLFPGAATGVAGGGAGLAGTGPLCVAGGCPAFHVHVGPSTIADVNALVFVPVTIPYLCVISFNFAGTC